MNDDLIEQTLAAAEARLDAALDDERLAPQRRRELLGAEFAAIRAALRQAPGAAARTEAPADGTVAQLRQQLAIIRLLQQAAAIANGAESAPEAVQQCLDQICAYTGWPVGHAYLVDPDSGELHSSGIWHLDDPARFALFRRVSEEMRFTAGVGLPGRVLEHGGPAWIEDIDQDENFPRKTCAGNLGVRAGLAFPVLVGPTVVAVLEFFATAAVRVDSILLQILAQIGTQLGRVFERDQARAADARATARLRDNEQRLALIFNSVSDGLTLIRIDPGRRYRVAAINPPALGTMGMREAEVVGADVAALFPAAQYEQLTAAYAEVIRHRQPLTFECPVELPGGPVVLAISVLPVCDAQGECTHLLGVAHDITAHRRIEEQIRRLNGQLEQRVAERTAELAMINEALRSEIARREEGEAALRESLHFAQTIGQATPDIIYIFDLSEQRNIYASPAIGRILGYSPEEIAAFGAALFPNLMHPEDLEALPAQLQRLAALPDDTVHEFTYRLRSAQGEWHWLLSRELVFQRTADGAPQQILGFAQDITARKAAEDLLQHSLQRLSLLQAINQLALNLEPPEGIAAEALRQLQGLMPVQRMSVLQFEAGGQFASILATAATGESQLRPGTRIPIAGLTGVAVVREGRAYAVSDMQAIARPSPLVRALLREGLRAAYAVPMLVRGEIVGALAVYRSAPGAFDEASAGLLWEVANHLGLAIEHSRLFGQVQAGRQRLQVLTRKLLEVQEAERQELARELHDELGQTLTAVKINLQAAQRARPAAEIVATLADTITIIEQALQQVRVRSLNLRPALLDDLGLAATLRWYLDRQQQRTGLRIQLTTDLSEGRLAAPLETACFRIVQEALTNIARHAQAQRVEVELSRHAGEILLRIRDDGVGFDVEQAVDRSLHETSLGLLGMQERATLLGGQLTIASAPGAGTTITARLPLEPMAPLDRRRNRRGER